MGEHTKHRETLVDAIGWMEKLVLWDNRNRTGRDWRLWKYYHSPGKHLRNFSSRDRACGLCMFKEIKVPCHWRDRLMKPFSPHQSGSWATEE